MRKKQEVLEYQKSKESRIQEEEKYKLEEQRKKSLDTQLREERQRENKEKLKIYKEFKAKQIEDERQKFLQMSPSQERIVNTLPNASPLNSKKKIVRIFSSKRRSPKRSPKPPAAGPKLTDAAKTPKIRPPKSIVYRSIENYRPK
mmetsp:Transcript_28674/g.43305  ORF Transcript_28674/g.43305 Transcript_28674/m.43305 type:complete len:145 (+) Transcript_28674:1936-2370(+)